jgi:Holliday junction resolvase RusA-like endonuclease
MTRSRTSAKSQGATVTLNWPINTWPNSNRDRHKHWTKQRREAAEIRVAAFSLARGMHPVETPANMTVSFAFPDKRRRDLDNYSIKAFVDGLVDSGLIPDDDHAHVTSVTRTLDPAKTDKGTLRITVQLVTVGAV